jgi:chorismate mutase/prephenate dehydrogenase
VNAFTRLLTKKNHKITLYDIDKTRTNSIAEKYNSTITDSLQELTQATDITIISTPLGTTPTVIQKTIETMSDGTIVEIASLKKRTVPILQKAPNKVQTVSIHPMFGPNLIDLHNATIVTIPVKDRETETHLSKSLFPEAKHFILDAEKHDKYMSLILALPYFINIVFLKCLPHEEMEMIKTLAGPTFQTQFALAECVLGENPEFVKSLIEDNLYVRDNLNKFIYEYKYLRRLLKSKPWELGDYLFEVRQSMGSKGPEYSKDIRNIFMESLSHPVTDEES